MELARTVLVVEDESAVGDLVAATLRGRGYTVAQAGDAASATGLLDRRLPDLLVTDMMLPGASGFEVIRAVRSRPGGDRVPVVMMSGNASPAHQDYAHAAGADRFIAKPFTPGSLLRVVTELCPHRPAAAIRAAALTGDRHPA